MDGIQEESDRQDAIDMLNAPPDGPAGERSGKRTPLPLEGAPAWYNGDDDEGYSAQAAMTKLGRVRR